MSLVKIKIDSIELKQGKRGNFWTIKSGNRWYKSSLSDFNGNPTDYNKGWKQGDVVTAKLQESSYNGKTYYWLSKPSASDIPSPSMTDMQNRLSRLEEDVILLQRKLKEMEAPQSHKPPENQVPFPDEESFPEAYESFNPSEF